ncbi:MAG: hypothetical protein KKD39_07595 [Candidatus Altiarchaeota archaeon]|nr:hypothetical protein [Candidatus Altiarchaeota archaeon]
MTNEKGCGNKQNKPNKNICLACKGGRLLCGEKYCPLIPKTYEKKVKARLSKEMFGPSTSVFVGWNGYPTVSAGPMTSLDDKLADVLDNPGAWYGKTLQDIVNMRSMLVRGRQKRPVSDRSKYVEEMQELALSVKAVDVEAHYKTAPQYSMSFSPIHQPMGAQGDLKKFKITENTVIPRKVDYIVSDDLKSTQQVVKLFDSNFDVYYLTDVISSGTLGGEENKRLVPTRWSITAVDDMLAKEIIVRLKDMREVSQVEVYENTYMENHFEILVIPGAWEFELFEAWSPNTIWGSPAGTEVVVEHELNKGRKEYAYNEGGGYYAARFAAAEALYEKRRQGRCVIFREIYDTYVMPVGVWEVRENVRAAMGKPPQRFPSVDSALDDIKNRLNLPIHKYLSKSTILRQRRLTDYETN